MDVVGLTRAKRAKGAKRALSEVLMLEVAANEVTGFPLEVENCSGRTCEGKALLMFLYTELITPQNCRAEGAIIPVSVLDTMSCSMFHRKLTVNTVASVSYLEDCCRV